KSLRAPTRHLFCASPCWQCVCYWFARRTAGSQDFRRMLMRLSFTIRFALAVLTFAPALLAANSALAQAGALVSLFNESLTDAAGNNIPLPAVRPLVNVQIPESHTAEGTFTITVPAMNIGFVESTATGSGPSDFLHINSYQVIVRSDDEVGLP